ncbi:MAG: class I SAM-dependent methyltransferase [Minisyncoccia bacterium]|jgi:ubiquinone/menaquinone biosynthesis C-methylase UbiE
MSSFLNPQTIVNLLPLTENMVVADFGCGNGYFSLELARKVKPNGKVIALDIWKPSLESLSFKSKIEGLNNIIQTKWANLELEKGSGLENKSCDLVFMSNILFEIKDKKQLIKEAERILKPNGFLVVIEWEPNKLPNSQFLFPLTKDEAIELIESFGFHLERELVVAITHYGLLFKLDEQL